ncbi:histidinol-phosphate aminotransferase family protein [Hyphomonas sp. WL0036]|uniref:pyridoxal phosphate-dependent aminotransferase n=1 Tax=Hyphomonas sediminis TaxID=2866160 RepID=UPI001C7ED14D|nr:histidinol-phosphate transaminase [Hyphomonas sediminis]MBY9068021.1 histidinol-phosphate aminotransferase family protein [Hyphomonas sediminis]
MGYRLTRRSLFSASASTVAVGLAGCASTSPAASAEAIGAFPLDPQSASLFGPEPGLSLLSRNENPYGPASSALEMISASAKKGAYYTNDEATKTLAAMIAERHGVAPEQVVITTGSGEALSALALIYGPKGPIVAPRLFWDTTALYAAKLGMAEIIRIPLTEDMDIDLAGIDAAITPETGMVQLCNPNNPTGIATPGSVIRAAVAKMAEKTTVVVDEAYIELVDDEASMTCVPLIKQGKNVIVTRTFSKIYGMAGIRVGYTISSAETAAAIRSTLMSWTPCTSIAAAIGCYNDTGFLDYSKSKIVEGRQMVTQTLDQLGLSYLKSQTNFVYFQSGLPANDLQKAMAAENISIRGQYMDYTPWSRVSMGKLDDVEKFCKALPRLIKA